MKPRHIALGAALAGAALLVMFGERAPDTDVAEAVERPAARADAVLVPTSSLKPVSPVPAASVSTAAASAAPASVPASAPTPASAAASARGAGQGGGASASGQQILALVPRDVLIGNSDGRFGQGGNDAAGVFGSQNWTPPPPPPQPAPPPPPPSAPPLPFTFIGKSVGAGAWEVYLARGDRTYVVRADTVIDGTYRVDAIAPPVLTLTYLPLNQVQQLNIGVFE